jgi:7-cyano-7-deazaguanine tRNA-ribosyltransferase
MTFEIKYKDLLARIGKLKTKSGVVETPLLFPVINPNIQLITPERLKADFGFQAVITNAYILKKRFKDKPIKQGLHKFLNFDGPVMTDSGAYQILVYGDIEICQTEIVNYQEQIGSDIATILDIPTAWKITKPKAQETVKETIKRAKEFFAEKTRDDILWVGPIQGGRHLDLVSNSATQMSKLPFQIYALGSPTEVMENYRFDVLVDMILNAKMNLPIDKPLHLFGAGHPQMFSLAVALGCDLFDSAAYALYARENRYMTENGTWRLSQIDYFPCQCSKCISSTPKDVLGKAPTEREEFLAEHNLYVCQAELNRIKQAIRDGRLWEYIEMRTHAHPALFTALKRLRHHVKFIQKFSPTIKHSGLFYFSSVGLSRPEISIYKQRLLNRYIQPENTRVLLLVPQTPKKPMHKAHEFNIVTQVLEKLGIILSSKVHVCFYTAPFGIIPLELDEVYPLSQHEIALPLDQETIYYVAETIAEYIRQRQYTTVVLLNNSRFWDDVVLKQCIKSCKEKKVDFEWVDLAEGSKTILTRLEMILREQLSEKP